MSDALVALVLVALVSGLIGAARVHWSASNFAVVYLAAVVGSALLAGNRAAILASLGSFLAYDLLFIAPHYTLAVRDPEEWVNLAALLGTGIVTARLVAGLRRGEAEALASERVAATLYRVEETLAGPLDEALPGVAELLRDFSAADAVQITRAGVPGVQAIARRAGLDAFPTGAARDRVLSAAPRSPSRAERVWVRIRGARRHQRPGEYNIDRVRLNPANEVGWIWIARHPTRPEWTDRECRLLLTVASQVSRATDREELRQEANRAEAFRQADELKSMLLNAVSHDLRTPLASILASAESLLDEEVSWSEEARTEFAEAIAVEGRRLDRMVRHLLDLSRVERGALRLEREWVDLEALVGDVISRSRALAVQQRLSAAIPDNLSPIFVDPVLTAEILTNLVENAVLHTPPGSTIKLVASEHGDWIEVGVEDDGPGLEEHTLEHLFEVYPRPYQGSRTSSTGLGLAVASALVKAHGGTMSVRNLQPRGARFAFELPAGRPAMRPTTVGVPR